MLESDSLRSTSKEGTEGWVVGRKAGMQKGEEMAFTGGIMTETK
jgi:hypothetical protein